MHAKLCRLHLKMVYAFEVTPLLLAASLESSMKTRK